MMRLKSAGMNPRAGFALSRITSNAIWHLPQRGSSLIAIGLCITTVLAAWASSVTAAAGTLSPVHSIGIVLNADASPAEQRVANVLKTRILNFTPIAVEIGQARKAGADLYIHLGVVQAHGVFHDL